MNARSIHLHCPFCRKRTLYYAYRSNLFPDTYNCTRCGKPRKWRAEDSADSVKTATPEG